MRVLVLPEVLHDGEVHKLSIDKSGEKLLSGGKDGSLNLWDIPTLTKACKAALSDIKSELEMLQPMKTYQYDDSMIVTFIWSPIDSDTFVTGDANGRIHLSLNHQHKLLFPTNGSCSQIVDITWSSDGRLILWSSQDGKVHIYDLTKDTYQELTTLFNSEKLVVQQSVTFDPNNKYLATLGTDSILHIYQYRYEKSNYQFKVQNRITRFMNNTNSHLIYNRISWSSNGEFLLIPSAKKNNITLITLISRTTNWDTVLNLAGHNANCEVVRFNPQFFCDTRGDGFQSDDDMASKYFQPALVIASGGTDKTLAVWNSNNDSPLFVLKNLVTQSIVDICWDKTGYNLFLASMDGHITVVTFEENELGEKETNKSLFEVKEIPETKAFNSKQETVNPRSRSSNTVEVLDQKDAKLVLETEDTVDISEQTTTKATESSISNQEHHSFVPKVLSSTDMNHSNNIEDILSSAMEERLQSLFKVKPTSNGTSNIITELINISGSSNKFDITKQNITNKNGKKRIQPMLVSNNNNNTPLIVPNSPRKKLIQSSKDVMEYEQPSYNISNSMLKQLKRQKVGEESNKKSKRELEATKFLGSPVINPNVTFAKTRLATPKVRYNFSLSSKVQQSDNFILDIKNGSGNEEEPSRITYFKKSKQVWCDFIPRYIHLATEGNTFWAISTNDGQVLTYSHSSGKRMLPPIILGSPLSFLESHGNYLMAITSIGELYVWDIVSKKLLLNSPLAINALLDANSKYQDEGLSRSNRISLCSVTSSGVPLITLTNGSGYLYNKDLGVWQIVTESWWAFGSHYWNSLSDSTKLGTLDDNSEADESLTALLEHKTNEEILKQTRTGRAKLFNKISKNILMKEGFESLENTVSLTHLENRILCCEILGETKDFREFFLTYVKRVCELGLKVKVFEVCNQLVKSENDDTWTDEVCGIKKYELLKEVVFSCSEIRDSQRIITHFAKKAGLL